MNATPARAASLSGADSVTRRDALALAAAAPFAAAGLLHARPANAATGKRWNLTYGVAIKGYNTVAYHALPIGQAVKGQSQFSVDWMKALWFFSTIEEARMFKKDPDRFAVRCGGFDALAAIDGTQEDIDPTAFLVFDKRLYLFSSAERRDKFAAEAAKLAEAADAAYARLIAS